MNIQSMNQNTPALSFKKVYPVMHCVREGNKFYKANADMSLVKRLQGKLVRVLNKPEEYYFDFFCKNPLENVTKAELEKAEAKELEPKVRELVGWSDIDYRNAREVMKVRIRKLMVKIKNLENQGIDSSKEKEELAKLKNGEVSMVRSFYNRTEGDVKGKTWPSFLISGIKDIEDFIADCGAKDIGKSKGAAKKAETDVYTEQTKDAIDKYNKSGYEFVNNPARRMLDRSGISYYLRTIFEPIRNKKGKIKDYRLVGVEFLPTGKTAPSK